MKKTFKLVLLLSICPFFSLMMAQNCEQIYESKKKNIKICSGISLKSPVDLVQASLPVSAGLKDQISHIDLHTYMNNPALKIKIQCVAYSNNFRADIDKILTTTDAELQKIGGTDIQYKNTPMEKDDVEGVKQEGWMTIGDQMYDFVNVIIHRDNYLWQFLIAHEQHDMFGYVIADNFVNSITYSSVEQ